MKKILFFVATACSLNGLAQSGKVGINTIVPKASLDVEKSTTFTAGDQAGIAFPRLTGNQIKTMSLAGLKTGTMVYAIDSATAIDSTTLHAKKISKAGFYYFDSSVWQPLTFGTNNGEWLAGTSNSGQSMIYAKRAKEDSSKLVAISHRGALYLGTDSTAFENRSNPYSAPSLINSFSIQSNKIRAVGEVGNDYLSGHPQRATIRQIIRADFNDDKNYIIGDIGNDNAFAGYSKYYGKGYRHSPSVYFANSIAMPKEGLLTLKSLSSYASSNEVSLNSTSSSSVVNGNIQDFKSYFIINNYGDSGTVNINTASNFLGDARLYRFGNGAIRINNFNGLELFNSVWESPATSNLFIKNYAHINAYGSLYKGTIDNFYGLKIDLFPTNGTFSTRVGKSYGIKIGDMLFGDTVRYAIFTGIGKNSFGDTVQIRNINTTISTDTADKIVMADGNGVLKTKSATTISAFSEPWFKVGTTTGAIANTDSVFIMGNVGIGTNNPTQKLEVNGTIKATNINFTGLPVYPDEAAASSLTTGDMYRTPTGELRIKL